MKRSLRCLQWSLFASSLALLGYAAFVAADAWAFERTAVRRLETLRVAPAFFQGAPPAPSDLIGLLQVPRLDLSVIVIEGTGPKTLRRAAGHIEGTRLPGQPGNVGVSAHRDTFFRPLRNVQVNDRITLTTPLAEYEYRVSSTKVVEPEDVSVLDSTETETLTLVRNGDPHARYLLPVLFRG
jgi:sortase A